MAGALLSDLHVYRNDFIAFQTAGDSYTVGYANTGGTTNCNKTGLVARYRMLPCWPMCP